MGKTLRFPIQKHTESCIPLGALQGKQTGRFMGTVVFLSLHIQESLEHTLFGHRCISISPFPICGMGFLLTQPPAKRSGSDAEEWGRRCEANVEQLTTRSHLECNDWGNKGNSAIDLVLNPAKQLGGEIR